MYFGTASGRAHCGKCAKLIEKGEDDITANLGSGRYARRYHVKCFKVTHWSFIVSLYNSLTEAEREDIERG